MEAARHAALRGHNVTIFEKTGELGGAILGDCLVKGKEKMKWYADWIRNQVKSFDNIKVELNHAPNVKELKSFDIVANATDATSYVPNVYGDTKSVVNFEDVLACPKEKCEFNPKGRKMAKVGDKVLIWGDHYQAVSTAQFLASIGKKVTIVTENPSFAADVEVIHMYVVWKRFALEDAESLTPDPYKHAVEVIVNATVLEIAPGKVVIEDRDFNKRELEIDTVVTCLIKPNLEFMDEAVAAGLQVVNIGDSVKPRNLHAAVLEGAVFGKNVEGEALVNPNNAPVNGLPVDLLKQLTS